MVEDINSVQKSSRSFGYYYLDIETVPYAEFMDFPGASFDPIKSKIISIQFQPLDTLSGCPSGEFQILKEWDWNEKIIVEEFRRIYIDNGVWSFIPVGNNLVFENRFLKYKFHFYCGLDGQKLGQRPMIDIKPILIMKNRGRFRGCAQAVGKIGEAQNISKWYASREYKKIESYIIKEAENFLQSYCILKRIIPEIIFPSELTSTSLNRK
jgi:hypothetical protein